MTEGRSAPSHAAAPQPKSSGWHLAEWACELIGTATLVFVGLSAVVYDFSAGSPVARLIPSASGRLLLTGSVFAGAGSLFAITPLGRRSGAHINPAVTLAFWCTGHVHRGDLGGYVVGQLLGGLVGAGALRLAWGARGAQVGYGVTQPGPHTTQVAAVGLEALMTAALVLTIFAFVASPRTARWTPLAVWVVVALLVWRGAPHTGTSLNPARSLGPAVVSSKYHALWVYAAGPLTGALAAFAIWSALPRWQVLTAKLFHDPRYPSVVRTDLPAMPAGTKTSGRSGPASRD